jgi:hypothetical protein
LGLSVRLAQCLYCLLPPHLGLSRQLSHERLVCVLAKFLLTLCERVIEPCRQWSVERLCQGARLPPGAKRRLV